MAVHPVQLIGIISPQALRRILVETAPVRQIKAAHAGQRAQRLIIGGEYAVPGLILPPARQGLSFVRVKAILRECPQRFRQQPMIRRLQYGLLCQVLRVGSRQPVRYPVHALGAPHGLQQGLPVGSQPA